jgi:hypothetical protein
VYYKNESKMVTGTGIMLGQVAGYRRQGKPQMHWLNSIKEATGLHLEALTLSLPMTTIVAPQLNVIKWQMGFNSAG